MKIINIAFILLFSSFNLIASSNSIKKEQLNLDTYEVISDINKLKKSFIHGKIITADIDNNKDLTEYKTFESHKIAFKNVSDNARYNSNPVSYILSLFYKENETNMIYVSICSVVKTKGCKLCDISNGEGSFKENDIICQSKIMEYK